MRKSNDYYNTKATIQHADGRVVIYRYGMTTEEFKAFSQKVIEPTGDKVLSVENIKEPIKYYS